MKNRIYNPYLPLNEYVPDGEPHVFNNRLYIFGSHDEESGNSFCPLDYVAWSAPVNDLSEWKYEGIIYTKGQDPFNSEGTLPLYAPDVVRGNDGRYYLYYGLDMEPVISVAVCDEPAGHYEFYGRIRYADGTELRENMPFDPAVINDNGRIYLYYGFCPPFPIFREYQKDCPGCSVVELADDMLTLKTPLSVIIPRKEHAVGTSFEGHGFFEAASIRKFGDTYYLVYASELSHELCYAVSKEPDKNFVFGGTIISNGDVGFKGRTKEHCVAPIGNNHGGLVEVDGDLYIFYHRHTHGTMFSRQSCAERVSMDASGHIAQVEVTSSGLSATPFEAEGIYPAAIACNLLGKDGAKAPTFGKVTPGVPMVASDGDERFIAQIEDGAVIGYKYFSFKGKTALEIQYRGNGDGVFEISGSMDGESLGSISVVQSEHWHAENTSFDIMGISALFLRYKGTGCIQLFSIKF